MTMSMIRQGDVLLTRVHALPPGVIRKPAADGRVVLAYGEVTGHAHALDAALSELFEARAGTLYLRASAGAHLVHEEHGAIALDPGVYRVTRQREYAPDAIRPVAD